MHRNCFKLCLEWIQTSLCYFLLCISWPHSVWEEFAPNKPRLIFYNCHVCSMCTDPIYLIYDSNNWYMASCPCLLSKHCEITIWTDIYSTSCSELVCNIACNSCSAFRYSLSHNPPPPPLFSSLRRYLRKVMSGWWIWLNSASVLSRLDEYNGLGRPPVRVI